MEYLVSTGRSFRAERVPLCYMRRFAWASTEARKIIKEEERCIRFLDFKGFIHQKEFLHGKGTACDACRFDPICAGMFSMAKTYDERELSPIFDDPIDVIVDVLGRRAVAGAAGAAAGAARPALEDRAAVAREAAAGDAAGAVAMPRFLFVNPPLVLDDDFIDYPYFANHGLLACAGLAARAGAQVEVYDAFALPASGRHRRADGGFVLGVEHDDFIAGLPDDAYDVVVLGASVFLRIEAAHAGDARADRRAARAVPALGAAALRRLRRRPALHGLRRRAGAGATIPSSTRS